MSLWTAKYCWEGQSWCASGAVAAMAAGQTANRRKEHPQPSPMAGHPPVLLPSVQGPASDILLTLKGLGHATNTHGAIMFFVCSVNHTQ